MIPVRGTIGVVVRRAGVTGFVLGYLFGDLPIDLAFPGQLVAVEVDGWAWHTDPSRFASDRAKGNALVAAGWLLLRFTWADITDHPDRVVQQIRSALEDRRAGSGMHRIRRDPLSGHRP